MKQIGVFIRRQTLRLSLLIGILVLSGMTAGYCFDFGFGKRTPTIAILGAEDAARGGIAEHGVALPAGLADRIAERLTNSRRYSVLERKVLQQVVGEQRFGEQLPETSLDRLLDEAASSLSEVEAGSLAVAGVLATENDALKELKELGSTVGADYLVYAKLEKMQLETKIKAVPYSTAGKRAVSQQVNTRLYLRVIEVEQGRIVGAASLAGHILENPQKAPLDSLQVYDELGRLAAGRIIDMISPAKLVSDVPVVLNRGKNDGVKVGDLYAVHSEGKEIEDSNGTVLGRVKSQVGTIRLTQVQENISVAEVIDGNVSKSDLAERIPAVDAGASKRSEKVALTPVGHGKLPRVAVGLLKLNSTAQTVKDVNKHVPMATDSIISRLAQTKRFVVVDRQEVDQLLDEQAAQAMAENQALPSAIGSLKGADYLIYGSLASVMVTTREARLPGTSRTVSSRFGQLEGNIRIVDVQSGDILESRKVSVTQKLAAQDSEERTIALLADAFAEKVVLNLMNRIYPIKVAAVGPDGVVYINRGEDGGLSSGEVLEAYRPGAAVIDPDTGIPLGTTESTLGQVRVAEVEENRAKGESTAALQQGDLLKRLAANKDRRTGSTSAATPARNGADLLSAKPKGKATVAIGKFIPGERGNHRLLVADLRHRLTAELIGKLTKTRRFQVMERQQLDQILDEKAFAAIAQGGGASAALGQLQGADYLVYGTVDEFYFVSEKKKIAALDEVMTDRKGRVEAELRIVDVHSGKVVASERVSIDHKLSPKQDQRQMVSELLDRLSSGMVSGIVSQLDPLKVVGIAADGTVYVNRGEESGLLSGQEFRVMRPGERMVDKETGLDYGTAEMEIGTLVLTQIESGRARAKQLAGGEILKGDRLRKVHAPKSASGSLVGKRIRKVNKPSF